MLCAKIAADKSKLQHNDKDRLAMLALGRQHLGRQPTSATTPTVTITITKTITGLTKRILQPMNYDLTTSARRGAFSIRTVAALSLPLLLAACAAPPGIPAPRVAHSGLERVWIEALGME